MAAHPSWYISLPILLLVLALGLTVCGVLSAVEELPAVCWTGMTQGIVTMLIQVCNLVAEHRQLSYSYYAILLPDSAMLLWYTVTFWYMVAAVPVKSTDHLLIAVLVLNGLGWLILIVTVVLFSIAVKQRQTLGTCTSPRRLSGPSTGRQNDNKNIENGLNGTTTGTGEIRLDDLGSIEDTSTDQTMAQMNGNRITSEEIICNASPKRESMIHYDLGQPYHSVPSGTLHDHTSVHYVEGPAEHPLRMNPPADPSPKHNSTCCVFCTDRARGNHRHHHQQQ